MSFIFGKTSWCALFDGALCLINMSLPAFSGKRHGMEIVYVYPGFTSICFISVSLDAFVDIDFFIYCCRVPNSLPGQDNENKNFA